MEDVPGKDQFGFRKGGGNWDASLDDENSIKTYIGT